MLDPDLIFLSEPWMFQSDIPIITKIFDEYNVILNSDDKYDEELPLRCSRAYGGTLTLYKKHLEPYVTEIDSSSSRILPIILNIPEYNKTVHVNVYLPTSGRENEFVDSLAHLKDIIEEVSDDHPGIDKYIRGDANATCIVRDNNNRDKLFKHVITEMNLNNIEINHKTYHHFVGEGMSDSNIDVIIESTNYETVSDILCSKTNSNIESHHDVIVTKLVLPFVGSAVENNNENIKAPKIENKRVKIKWSAEGIVELMISLVLLLSTTLMVAQKPLITSVFSSMLSFVISLTPHVQKSTLCMLAYFTRVMERISP